MLETRLITIDGGRDGGKTFRVREMSALQLEKWAARALIAIFGSQADIPPELAEAAQSSNTVALAQAGMRCLSGLDWEKVEPLYDELLRQVDRVPDIDRPEAVVRLHNGNADAHVASAGTLLRLRAEVVALCLGFSTDGVSWGSLPATLLGRPDSGTTQISPKSSAA